ncbi:MAG: lytic transglycosylase domain-containing protein, partial [Chitinophagales bacterium]|nr:lytic transglycosylase domain-containing protein [Chitinophagales bacterium]
MRILVIFTTFLFGYNAIAQTKIIKIEDSATIIDYTYLNELTNKYKAQEKKDYFAQDDIQSFVEFDPSMLPDFSDEYFATKVYSMPSSIRLGMTRDVAQTIRYFGYKKREYMTKMLTNSQAYFPLFESLLEKRGMPKELKYLAIVESALNPNARSKAGATGLWQFMSATAREEGLMVNKFIDERKDIFKSTEFALDFLQKLYNNYGDWLLALAAYNSGPGNVNKAIRKSGGYDYWSIRHHLPRETRQYVPNFIAIMYVMVNHEEFMLYPSKSSLNFKNIVQCQIDQEVSINHIADLCKADIEEIKAYNPALIQEYIPNLCLPYQINLPIDKAKILNKNKDFLAEDPYLDFLKPNYYQPKPLDHLADETTTSSETASES